MLFIAGSFGAALQVDPGQEKVRVGRDFRPLLEQRLQLLDAGAGALQLEQDAGVQQACLGPHVPAGQDGLDLGQGGGVFAPAEQVLDRSMDLSWLLRVRWTLKRS